MEYKIIDGKATATAIKAEIAEEVKKIMAEGGKQPHLAAVLVGHDGGSETYVKNKVLACEACGFKSTLIRYEEDITEEELLACVARLNADPDVDGFIVQLPLPKHIDEQKIIEAIDYRKDVDGFHMQSVGALCVGAKGYVSCTPLGIIELLKRSGIEIAGKHCVVIGRSNIVGKPMALLLLRENGTVTVCHSRTQDLKEITGQADILVVAIGKPKMITREYVKEGAVVIDVGIHRNENNKLCGDVDFDDVAPVCSAITPVPGGVGPMTIAMLMKNCLTSVALMQNQ